MTELKKTSKWTEWIQVNKSSEDSWSEQRYRCLCKACMGASSQLYSAHIKVSHRVCAMDHLGCQPSMNSSTYSQVHDTYKKIADGITNKQNSIWETGVISAVRNKTNVSIKSNCSKVFSGFCNCRDLGLLRICRRCLQ